MKQAKYKIGQTVYGQSDWFAGSYIPDSFVIRKSEVVMVGDNEEVIYYVKHRRTPIFEYMLFATEEEAQLNEFDRFKNNTEKEVELLKKQLEEVGADGQELLSLEDYSQAKKHRYHEGDIVYGHMNGGAYEYKPETFEIKEKGKVVNEGKTYFVYKVKGHGSRVAYEDFLYPTKREAVIADLIRFKRMKQGELKSIKSRAVTLGIENKVKTKILEWANTSAGEDMLILS